MRSPPPTCWSRTSNVAARRRRGWSSSMTDWMDPSAEDDAGAQERERRRLEREARRRERRDRGREAREVLGDHVKDSLGGAPPAVEQSEAPSPAQPPRAGPRAPRPPRGGVYSRRRLFAVGAVVVAAALV